MAIRSLLVPGTHLLNSSPDPPCESLSLPTERQRHDTGIRDRAMLGDPPLAHQGGHHPTHCRESHAERRSGVRQLGLCMTTQKKKHPCLERRHSDRFQAPSDVAFKLQDQFEDCRPLLALARGISRGQCVVPFATRWPISIIRPNRSSRFCDWCEVRPCLLSRARISSMIVFSVSVRRYGSGKTVSGMLARGVLRRNSVMMS